MHRLILGASGAEIVDHINGNGLDNRRSNLRIANALESARNTGARGSTKLKGVRRVSAGKFVASIAPNGVEIYLGTYDTAEAAAAIYNAAAIVAYREFARLNPGGAAADVLNAVISEKRRAAERLLEEVRQLSGVSQWNP